jgi:hypothetical protein
MILDNSHSFAVLGRHVSGASDHFDVSKQTIRCFCSNVYMCVGQGYRYDDVIRAGFVEMWIINDSLSLFVEAPTTSRILYRRLS